MTRALAIAVLFAMGATASAQGWYNAAWPYRKKITVDHTKVSADLTNFPMYLDLSGDTDIAAHARADNSDLVFTASDGTTVVPGGAGNIQIYAAGNGVWSWFGDPRAVRYHGTYDRTYVGWLTRSGVVWIMSYDHDTKATASMALTGVLQVDDHANPSILVRNDGKIMVFYCAHNGTNMYYRVSTNAEDVTAFDAEQTVGADNGNTYPNPVQLSGESNKIYLFWRGANWFPTYSTSTDSGATWAAKQILFYSAPGARPYTKVASNDVDRIHFCFTDGQPSETTNNSIYYAYYYNGNFYRADGTLAKSAAALPLLTTDCDKVYDSVATGYKAWNHDIALDADGYPVIVYAEFVNAATDHRYRYARWNGSAWVDHEVTPAGGPLYAGETYYTGGITLDHSDPSIVYLSRYVGSQFEIERWVTTDDGATWSSTALTSSSAAPNFRPIVPRGHASGGMGAIWLHGTYTTYENYVTALRTTPTAINGSTDEAWVNVPSVSSASDTDLYVYYGNAAQTTLPSTAFGAWDANHQIVNHMDGANTQVGTAALTQSYGIKLAAGEPAQGTGKIGNGQAFDGSNDYLEHWPAVNMQGWTGVTVEGWVKYTAAAGHNHAFVSNWDATKAAIMARINPTGAVLQGYVIATAQVGGSFADITFDANWHHIAITYDNSGGMKAYKDGVASSTTYAANGALKAVASVPVRVGTTPHNAADVFKGSLDEIRVSNTARSAAWIAARYANESAVGTFVDYGLEESQSGGVNLPAIAQYYRRMRTQ